MKTNKKGISLIVLVITIIVMIILATAIVLSLTSNNIVDSAKEATAASDFANAKQLVMVAEAEWEMEPEEGYTLKTYAESKLLAAGFNLGTQTGYLEVTNDAQLYVYPTIPKGFVASKASGESKVSEGLVIYQTDIAVTDENVDTARTTYNQYVWVPVEDITAFERVEWGKGASVANTVSYSKNEAADAVEYSALKESIEKYGGFYIGRYEAGKENDDTPVTKMGATVWREVGGTTAKGICRGLATDSVATHLVYGEEWDAALTFISKTDSVYPTDSTGKGNYAGSIKKAGSNNKYAVNNIYDMAGNVLEATMEEHKTDAKRILRGDYYWTGVNGAITGNPAAYRTRDNLNSSAPGIGFRVALYIK